MTFLFVYHTHEQLVNFDVRGMIRLTWGFYVPVFRIAGDIRAMWFHVVVICWKLNTIADYEVDFSSIALHYHSRPNVAVCQPCFVEKLNSCCL